MMGKMQPDFNAPTSFNLPPPVPQSPFGAPPEQIGIMPAQSIGSMGGVENQPIAGFEQMPVPLPPVAAAFTVPAATPMQPPVSMPAQQMAMAPATAVAATTPPVADDGDRIEKEWVLKAKQIVAATADDPFQQNRQLAHMKADYLQKRYGKIVKVTE